MANIVLLSGGSGTRLWPLSNATRSKQFLKVLRDEAGSAQSMVQRVMSQIESVLPESRIVISASSSQEASIVAQVDSPCEVVLEPERRDTAPAIMLAVSYLATVAGVSDDEAVIVLPIDSYVGDDYFDVANTVEDAVCEGLADLVLIGVEPSEPSSIFGYIVPGEHLSEKAMRVISFKEKPEREEAVRLINQGALWNCGAFGFRVGYVRGIIERYLPNSDYESVRRDYSQLPKNSFDYEVVERAESVGVVAYSGSWKDLGTWNSLSEEMHDPLSGNVVMGECNNTHVINELGIPAVVLGIDDAVVVATPDGLLVSGKEASSRMKPFVERAAECRAMCETRRWGEYRILDYSLDGERKSLTKRLLVKAGSQISYQRHRYRNEVWTIVQGEGTVVLDGNDRDVSQGDSVMVKAGTLHAILAKTDLSIIEVQTGTVLEEEDIERVGYYWESSSSSS